MSAMGYIFVRALNLRFVFFDIMNSEHQGQVLQ